MIVTYLETPRTNPWRHAKRQAALAFEDAFLKLVTVIQTIELRQSADHPIEDIVRPHEAKRIQHAFDLIHETRPLAVSKTEERREKYRRFLLQLKDDEVCTDCWPQALTTVPEDTTAQGVICGLASTTR